MLGGLTKTEICHRYEQDDCCCWKTFSPLFFQQQNGAPQENENNSRLLAERAQKKQRPGDKQENPSILTGRAQTAYSGIEAQEPKRRSEWIRAGIVAELKAIARES